MSNRLKWNNHKSTFFEILKTQREKSKYTDATLAVDGKFYPVHKIVLSTCSEYFSEIFERTACKSPVIVLKDVESHDIEALLDYIYVGEVDVKQDHLASLLKTANCLRVKGLGVPEEYQAKSHKNSISSHDVACARPYSPPPKKRRHDSNAALVNPNQSEPITSDTSSNTNQDVEPLFVKVELDESKEEEERFRKEDMFEAGVGIDHDPSKISAYDISKEEHEPESYKSMLLPGPSSSSLLVRVGLETSKEPDLRMRQKHIYKGGAISDHDPLGGNTEYSQEYYGSTPLSGSSLQQSVLPSVEETRQSRLIDSPLNLYEPNVIVRLDPTPAETPDIPGEDTLEIFEEEGKVYKYKRIVKGCNSGSDGIIEECEGIQRLLLIKKLPEEKKELFPYWVCNKLNNKKIKCKGKFLPKSRHPSTSTRQARQKAERTPHTCLGTPLLERNIAARRQVKGVVAANPNRACTSIADMALKDNYTPEDQLLYHPYAHTNRQLQHQANYAKKKGKMTYPPQANMWFELHNHIPEDF